MCTQGTHDDITDKRYGLSNAFHMFFILQIKVTFLNIGVTTAETSPELMLFIRIEIKHMMFYVCK